MLAAFIIIETLKSLSCRVDCGSLQFRVFPRPTFRGDPRSFFQPTLININAELQKDLAGLLDHIAEHDATEIYGATQGWGTSDEKLIRILTGRTKMQARQSTHGTLTCPKHPPCSTLLPICAMLTVSVTPLLPTEP